jgi:hypothetical protein
VLLRELWVGFYELFRKEKENDENT